MRRFRILLASLAVLAMAGFLSPLSAAPLTFVKLDGLVGGDPANTAVYRADIQEAVGVIDIWSITIVDGANGMGATGQFSGFDLDAIFLSTSYCETAACVAALTPLDVFDFSTAGTFFTPGAQMPPVDPKLFGTGPTGNTVDDAVATLGAFDANSTTLIPGAFGYVSLGEGGSVTFDLASALSTLGLYLYIGEVGDNGEVAAATITVSEVPEPAIAALFGTGLAVMLRRRRRR